MDKILYLDSDITVRTDVAELYSIDIEDYSLAAVEDVFAETFKKNFRLSESAIYINSGVMLLNLKKLCEIDIIAELQNLPECFDNVVFGDQDVINHLFQNKILILNSRWNAAKDVFYEELGREDVPSIIHYITSEKPWKLNSNAYSKEEYFKYLKLTPWYGDVMPVSKSEVIIRENICDIFEIQCSQENAQKYKDIIEEVKMIITQKLNPL